MPTQPVASTEGAQLLFELATGPEQGDVDLAGPREENLVDLVRRLVALRGDEVEVEPVPAPAERGRRVGAARSRRTDRRGGLGDLGPDGGGVRVERRTAAHMMRRLA